MERAAYMEDSWVVTGHAGMQSIAPVVVLARLEPQVVHTLDPGLLYFPTGHAVQAPLAPLLYVPAGHTICDDP